MSLNAARIVLAVLLIAVVGFCIFGFINTLDPEHENVVAWRTGYIVVGALAAIGAGWLIHIAWPRESE